MSYTILCVSAITDRPILEETGIVLNSALSAGGGLFLLEVNQTTPSASGTDHALVVKIRDENGLVYYRWLVTHSLSIYLVTNHCWYSPVFMSLWI